jgi:hypothetical protein
MGQPFRRFFQQKIFQRIFLVAFGLLIAAILVEILGRATHYLPTPPSDAYIRLTSAIGPLPDPASRSYNHSSTDEYNLWLDFNALGFRDPKLDFSNPAGSQATHILVIGDSYTSAWQVPLDQRWTEKMMALHPGWETLNLGMPNWGTDQEYLTYQNYPLAQDPDIVLLMFFAGNDVSDNNTLLLLGQAPNRPYFIPDTLPALKEIPWTYTNPFDLPARAPFPANVRGWLHNNSVVYFGISRIWNNLHNTAPVPASNPGDSTSAPHLPTELHVFDKHYTPDWETGWKVTDLLLNNIQQLTLTRGARFVIVMVPFYATVESSLTPAYIAANAATLDLSKPYQHMADFAKTANIPLLDLTSGFAQFYANDPQHRDLFFQADKHFTPLGNCLAGVLISNWLDPKLAKDAQSCP